MKNILEKIKKRVFSFVGITLIMLGIGGATDAPIRCFIVVMAGFGTLYLLERNNKEKGTDR